ncbi:unnamed protein product [Pleuronectes platessa]|uniref:Echinoderm microtubule-associated protein-like 1 n=1 Tax=Pleuronectes platessa TaxID=8262 RepID=A0A9N7ZD29_PLEPL|nr:unnamed protein product [Pleuronectes platessa]
MEGDPAYLSGARGGKRVCSREERKRRKTSGAVAAVVEGPSGQQRTPDPSQTSRVSHDDRSSAASGLDVADRLTYLEQRMQMQEDEIQLLKMALSDVLKRLNISEEHQAAPPPPLLAGGRRVVKVSQDLPVSLALPTRHPMVSTSSASLKKSSTLPSSSTARNYSPTPPRSGVKSPAGSVKDSPCKTPKSRPSSAASSCKKECSGSSSKTKEDAVSAVTMQIYLSPQARKTGSSETAKSASKVPGGSGPPAAPGNPPARGGGKTEKRRSAPSLTLNLQKTTTSQNTHQDTSSHKSPMKSPSQYFQICY